MNTIMKQIPVQILLLVIACAGIVSFSGKSTTTASTGVSTAAIQGKKPNIVLIITDQFRADACQREGFALNTTPFLDGLAASGTWFDKAYCASPACVPSRTSLWTGRYPNATHVRSNMNIQDAFFETDLAMFMKTQGYTTALIGKNHSYLKPKDFDFWREYSHLGVVKPENAGEEEVKKYLESTHFYMDAQPAPFPADRQLPAAIMQDAEKWISKLEGTDKPFFTYLSIPEPHNPYQVSEPYYSMFKPDELPAVVAGKEVLASKGKKWVLQQQMMEMGYPGYEKQIPRIRANYYGMMRLIDDQIKSFVNFLKSKSLYENTVFIFLADHGDFTGDYGLIKKGVEMPDCLTRVPMIWAGPGIKGAQLPSSAHVSNVDVLPTICDMLGAEIPEGVQGKSLWPILNGQQYPKDEFESILVQQGYGGLHYDSFDDYDPYKDDGNLSKGKTEFDELNTWTQSGMMRELRKGDYKLILDMQGAGQLYNLKEDRGELKNLYDDKAFAGKKSELLADMMAWELRVQDPLPLPHPNAKRKYGFKRDPRNYWSPYK